MQYKQNCIRLNAFVLCVSCSKFISLASYNNKSAYQILTSVQSTDLPFYIRYRPGRIARP
jgi:hypothetical protein